MSHRVAAIWIDGAWNSAIGLAHLLDTEKTKGTEIHPIIFRYEDQDQRLNHAARSLIRYYNLTDTEHRFDFRDAARSLLHTPTTDGPRKKGSAPYTSQRNALVVTLMSAVVETRCMEIIQQGGDVADAAVWLSSYDKSATGPYDGAPSFLSHLGDALNEGSLLAQEYGVMIRAGSLFGTWSIEEMAARGRRLRAPFVLSYSCARETQPPCGRCYSCTDEQRAMASIARGD